MADGWIELSESLTGCDGYGLWRAEFSPLWRSLRLHIGGQILVLLVANSHNAVFAAVLTCSVALGPRERLRDHSHLIHHLSVAEFTSSPVALFPTRMHVKSDIGCAEALAGGRIFINNDFALHVPPPLVDLAGFEAQALLQLQDLALVPHGISFEFNHQDFILLRVLTDSLLCFLGSFDPVSNDYARHKSRWEAQRVVSGR